MNIEYLPPDYKLCRSVLIDFGKACYASEAMLYTLSAEQKEIYKKCHPQIVPEVRNEVEKQSYCSDMYSFGRVLNQINAEILKTSSIQHGRTVFRLLQPKEACSQRFT